MKSKPKLDPYDIARIYSEMELYLVASMIRNYERHLKEQKKLGFKWEQWQLIQLRRIYRFRKESRRIIRGSSKAVKGAAKQLLIESYGAGKGKVEALIEAVAGDLDKAEHAIFRFVDDVYRQTIFRAQMYLDTGTMTLRQAVDLATKDFLDQGINCIEYKDGRRMNIASYAEMVLRTASQRATFMADGEKRNRWGVHTIFVSAHANACDLCIPWQGKVLIDDVYSSGIRPRDGNHPLLSEAMDKGLLHPNCRHTLATYLHGVTELPKVPDEAEARKNYEAEQKQRYLERQVRRWKRREAGSLDEGNKSAAKAKVREWQKRIREHLKENPQLRRDYWRERLLPETKAAEDFSKLQGLVTRDGIQINEITYHLQDRASMRNIRLDDIKEALHKPLSIGKIRIGKDGRPSKTYANANVTVALNPETGSLITVYKTPANRARKLKGDKK